MGMPGVLERTKSQHGISKRKRALASMFWCIKLQLHNFSSSYFGMITREAACIYAAAACI